MRLIKPATLNFKRATLPEYKPGPVASFFGAEPIPEREDPYGGRFVTSDCQIHFDVGYIAQIGVKRKTPVVFGTDIYYGILPVEQLSDRVYRCLVDHVGEVEIGILE